MQNNFRSQLCIFVFFMSLMAQCQAASSGEIWLLVDTQALTLSVMQNDVVQQTYDNMSIGRGGVTQDKIINDEKTPLGEFRIVRIAEDSPFHRFYGFDYPSLAHARRALELNVIDQRQFSAIRRALRAEDMPPQGTPLGGYLGIHGIGAGDASIHADFNWTNGCIALTNDQIDDLDRWIFHGMRVIVR
ncbi:MAG: L,D-transpeptidase [Thiogranum sp.]|nr:L,D-transpeptidase [Thiogranum sp.]